MSTTSDSDAVDSGSNLSVTLNGQACGTSSSTYGYCMGGNRTGNHSNVVDVYFSELQRVHNFTVSVII